MNNQSTKHIFPFYMPWLLTFCFVILRVTNVIEWSLWWVFSPVLVAYGLMLFIVVGVPLFILCIGVVLGTIDYFIDRSSRK